MRIHFYRASVIPDNLWQWLAVFGGGMAVMWQFYGLGLAVLQLVLRR